MYYIITINFGPELDFYSDYYYVHVCHFLTSALMRQKCRFLIFNVVGNLSHVFLLSRIYIRSLVCL